MYTSVLRRRHKKIYNKYQCVCMYLYDTIVFVSQFRFKRKKKKYSRKENMQTTILVLLLHAPRDEKRHQHTFGGVEKKQQQQQQQQQPKYKREINLEKLRTNKRKSLSAKCSSYYDYFVFSFRIFTILCFVTWNVCISIIYRYKCSKWSFPFDKQSLIYATPSNNTQSKVCRIRVLLLVMRLHIKYLWGI